MPKETTTTRGTCTKDDCANMSYVCGRSIYSICEKHYHLTPKSERRSYRVDEGYTNPYPKFCVCGCGKKSGPRKWAEGLSWSCANALGMAPPLTPCACGCGRPTTGYSWTEGLADYCAKKKGKVNPKAIKKPCNQPGCPAVTERDMCFSHEPCPECDKPSIRGSKYCEEHDAALGSRSDTDHTKSRDWAVIFCLLLLQGYDFKTDSACCDMCGKRFPIRALVLDHCHLTWLVRAMLCEPCNRHEGQALKGPWKPTERELAYWDGDTTAQRNGIVATYQRVSQETYERQQERRAARRAA